MKFDLKTARDSNTVHDYNEFFWRVFIEDKLFISDEGETTFDTEEEAKKSFFNSSFWKKVSEYVSCSQKFFGKENDNNWRTEFEEKIIHNLNITIQKYGGLANKRSSII